MRKLKKSIREFIKNFLVVIISLIIGYIFFSSISDLWYHSFLNDEISEPGLSPNELLWKNIDVEKINNADIKIVNFGDSVVQNGCPKENKLSERLNNYVLNYSDINLNKSISVLNIGLGGRDISYLYDAYNRILEDVVKPDIITLLTGWNEHWYEGNYCNKICDDNFQRKIISTSFLKNNPLIFRTKQASKTYIANKCYEEMKLANISYLIRDINHFNTSIYRISLDEYDYYLKKFLELSDENNITMILVIPPNGIIKNSIPGISLRDCTLLDGKDYIKIHNLYTSKVKEFALNNNISLIDLELIFKNNNSKLFFNNSFDPIHPSIKGNILCTKAYAEKLNLILN